jgi:hypothetical protein
MNFRGSSEPEVVVLDDDAIMDAVEELAEELETFAFERERVLVKLDIRAAAHARRTARELRLGVARLPLAADSAARETSLELIGDLLGRAHTILEGARHEAPGRPREGDPPMPSSRDAKTTPPPISDIRENSRDDFELDYDDLGATKPGSAEDSPELLAILHGMHPNQRPTAESMPAVTDADVSAASAEAKREYLPYFGDEDGENDFDDETVARKVAWERSGNRVLGR